MLACILPALNGCDITRAADEVSVTVVSDPAGEGGRYPHLVSGDDDQTIMMSWLEPEADGADAMGLYWSAYDGENWGLPERIKGGDGFFINWADFPSLTGFGKTPSAAHWLQKVPGSTYAYHVNMAFRSEGGQWGEPITPHQDLSPGEHGFVSLVPVDQDRVFAIWLDGYKTTAGGHGEGHHGTASHEGVLETAMTLHSAMVHKDGSLGPELEIDGSVCDCCQTSAARSGNNIIVVYRDRTEGEIRDIYRATYSLDEGSWSAPMALSTEGWEIAGCPVNGPQVSAAGDTVIATWFTAAGGQGRSYMAVSSDGGHSFNAPQALDTGASIGRVGVTVRNAQSALLTWIGAETEPTRIYGRLWDGSKTGAAFVVGEIDGSRASGFPRSAVSGEGYLVAWTEPGETYQVKTVRVQPGAQPD